MPEKYTKPLKKGYFIRMLKSEAVLHDHDV